MGNDYTSTKCVVFNSMMNNLFLNLLSYHNTVYMGKNITWIKAILIFAGLFNIGWGIISIFFQPFFFNLIDLPGPHEASIWRSSGILATSMGIGYLIASSNAFRYWPVVFIGLLTKLLMPLSIYIGYLHGDLPTDAFRMAVTNHLIWWIPFAAILYRIYQQPYVEDRDLIDFASDDMEMSMEMYQTSRQRTILEASEQSPVMMVFLRHFGCTFCREALYDISNKIKEIESKGTNVILVHMVSEEEATHELGNYGLQHLEHVSDPESLLYKGFRLKRGTFLELFGPKTLIRGFSAGVLHKHGLGSAMGDVYQMPGIFLIHKGAVIKQYQHSTASDKPPYVEIAECIPCID